MSIGVSSSCYYPLNTEQALIALGQAGIKTTEIFFNSNFERTAPFVAELAKIQKYFDIDIVSLHPSLSFAEPYYFFSEYKRRFDEYREDFKLYYEAAATLGAKYLIMHGDRPCNLSKITAEEYCRRFLLIAEDAQKQGVTLLQENVNKYRAASPMFIKKMLALTNGNVNFCLDIKQAIRAGFAVDEIVEAMSGKIRHIHISDSTPDRDCLLPKNGTFDFKKFFADMKKRQNYNGHYMIEVYSNSYSNIKEIAASYEKILPDYEDIC